jgi:hypothetical protein
VIKIKEEIERLEKAIQSTKSNEEKSSERPDNPAYVTLSSQLASTVAEIDSIYRQIKESERKAVDYRKRIEMTPRVEESYKEMLIERDNAYRKYNDLLQKSMEARVAQGLEKEQKGERFTLIDAARLPEKPYKPNRITILVVGLVLGMAAGGGLAAVRELSDQSIRNPEFLFAATGMPVLASIPILISDGDRLRKRNRRFIGIGGGILLLVIGLVSLHFFVMDLDILWIKLMRRLNRGF